MLHKIMVVAVTLLLACQAQKSSPSRKAPKPGPDASAQVVTRPVEPSTTKVSRAKFHPDAVKLIRLMMIEDLEGWFKSFQTVVSWGEQLGIAGIVEAKDVTRLYQDNEVAGDAKYKGKRFLISGNVISVRKEVTGKVFAELKGHDSYRNFHGFLGASMLAKAGDLKKGDDIKMVCTGGPSVMGTPIFIACEDSETILSQAKVGLNGKIDAWDNGEILDLGVVEHAAVTFASFMLVHDKAPKACLEKPDEKCMAGVIKAIENVPKLPKPEQETFKKQMKDILATMKYRPNPPEPMKP